MTFVYDRVSSTRILYIIADRWLVATYQSRQYEVSMQAKVYDGTISSSTPRIWYRSITRLRSYVSIHIHSTEHGKVHHSEGLASYAL